jgi:hypothetical protein
VPAGEIDKEVKSSTSREGCNEEREHGKEVIHVILIDARVASILAMGLWRQVDTRALLRRLVS